VVCIQTEVEVEEDKSSSIVIEVIVIVVVVVVVVVVVIVVVVVVVAEVAVPTFKTTVYKYGKSSLDLCTFVHTPSCGINDLLTLVGVFSVRH